MLCLGRKSMLCWVFEQLNEARTRLEGAAEMTGNFWFLDSNGV
jgi:hypothetical protein